MSFQYNIWFALYKHTVKIELMTVENKQTNEHVLLQQAMYI